MSRQRTKSCCSLPSAFAALVGRICHYCPCGQNMLLITFVQLTEWTSLLELFSQNWNTRKNTRQSSCPKKTCVCLSSLTLAQQFELALHDNPDLKEEVAICLEPSCEPVASIKSVAFLKENRNLQPKINDDDEDPHCQISGRQLGQPVVKRQS